MLYPVYYAVYTVACVCPAVPYCNLTPCNDLPYLPYVLISSWVSVRNGVALAAASHGLAHVKEGLGAPLIMPPAHPHPVAVRVQSRRRRHLSPLPLRAALATAGPAPPLPLPTPTGWCL